MILIADSGSTKTDWCVVLNGAVIKRLGTKGINPFFQSEEEIQQKLTASLLPQLPEGKFNAVYFYGAGCTPEKAPVLRRAIADSLPVIGYVARRLVSPVFWGRGPILVFTMEKRSSVTSLLSDLFWEMKVAVPYLENCW